MIRFYVARSLDSKKHLFPDLDIETLPNNGISFRFDHRRYRVWKSGEDGALPEPGNSRPMAEFLNQTLPLFDLGPYTEWNLAILWDFGEARHPELTLVLPQEVTGKWTPASAHWRERIPFNLNDLVVGEGAGTGGDGGGELPIRKLDDDVEEAKAE